MDILFILYMIVKQCLIVNLVSAVAVAEPQTVATSTTPVRFKQAMGYTFYEEERDMVHILQSQKYKLGALVHNCNSELPRRNCKCSGFEILNGPWGDNQTHSVQMKCDVNVPESKNAKELVVLLTLDRNTTLVDPHTLELVQILSDGRRFTFTNAWVVPAGIFLFDFELTYSIDQGNTEIPGGYCSVGGAVVVTTTIMIPTTAISTFIATTSTPIRSTSLTRMTTPPTITAPNTIPPTTMTIPAATVKQTTLIPTKTRSTSQVTPISETTIKITNALETTIFATQLPAQAVSTTPKLPDTTTSATSSTATVLMSTVVSSTTQQPTIYSNSNTADTSGGNIFTRLREGNIYSILFVLTITIGLIVLLALLRCCLYRCLFRRGAVKSEEDDKGNNMKNRVSNASDSRVQNLRRSASRSKLLPRSGPFGGTKIHGIGFSPLDFV